jgi:hypothetical protein
MKQKSLSAHVQVFYFSGVNDQVIDFFTSQFFFRGLPKSAYSARIKTACDGQDKFFVRGKR